MDHEPWTEIEIKKRIMRAVKDGMRTPQDGEVGDEREYDGYRIRHLLEDLGRPRPMNVARSW
jgi:hypothetical protein